ncbi:GntR family transcriptional regulator [Lacticigenium naphthae]|uniref:GntR family transcriptional regulator n=1 Tax=Lacticigenium naphthae TaxID=515351 RepID=UPI000401211A|nr:GntR family transcriptional regulator [Lacticigenium naphthae]
MSKSRRLESKAYQFIREKIEGQRWAQDTHLREEEIASYLNMSRTPVRKALHKLAAENMVEMIPYKGAVVLEKSLSVHEFQERLGFLELMLTHYLHKLQVNESTMEWSILKKQVQDLEALEKGENAFFEEEEFHFWYTFLSLADNEYNKLLILKTLREITSEKSGVFEDMQQSRSQKTKHLKQLVLYIQEQNYPYARREIRILLNQLNLNVIQG